MNSVSLVCPEVSIVMPCRNERAHIERCLCSILSQVPVPGGFEVIVADGLSDDGTREKLAELATRDERLRVVDNPGRIVSTGLNAAIRASRGGIIIRLDAHTEYAPDYITRCVGVLNSTGADSVGGPWIARGTAYFSRGIAAAFQCPWVVGGARGHDPDYEGGADTVYLGCWRKSAFERFGQFDEELVRNQDDEFSLRITRAGGRIWQSPSIRSRYHPRASLSALFRQYMQYGYWKVRVIQKHRLPASFRHLVPGCFVACLLALLPLACFSVWAQRLLVALAGAYAAANLTASIHAAARSEWRLLPILPYVVAAYQIGYGFGFVRGFLDFIILRRGPGRQFTKLTRSETAATSSKGGSVD